MLKTNSYGYAVMNKELDSYSFESIDLETCKKYCQNGNVIVKRIPYVIGINFTFQWFKPDKWFKIEKRLKYINIFYLHLSWDKEYSHKNGEIIYKS